MSFQSVQTQAQVETSDTIQTVDLYPAGAEDNQIVIPPLFEYVVAPDDLPDLQSRTDYLMENFWNPFDFKNTKVVDQNALNHAFGVYVQAMPYASEKKVMESVKKLIGKIKGNPGLSYQFAKAAEETLYGPRAELWADDIYMSFLQNLIDNKKVDNSKKKRYQSQLDLLKRTAVGSRLTDLTLKSEEGAITKFTPNKEFTLVAFVSPDCSDCRYSNVKLEISSIVDDLIEDSRLDVLIVGVGYDAKVADYSQKFKVMSSDNASQVMDIRMYPCFYIIDKEGKIVAKNLPVDSAIDILDTLSKQVK